MTALGVGSIGSKVLKNTRESSFWVDLSITQPVGQTVQLKNSWGLAYHTKPVPVKSISLCTSNSESGLGLFG